ncbi:hypothetical protein LTR84_000195 [Exophiala bonariae]|uniref:SnoaL-like domain-containing protein n=1 Tax=Exophiala bonariae TaxID=1690606 RepID=A0AAV9NQA4_9EURO|nr:hypothetical protein LTR84_000195 [Exophiala bonariae]
MGIDRDQLNAEVDKVYNNLQDQPQQTRIQISLVKKVIELHLVVFKHYDFDKISELVHSEYKQHSPLVGDGPGSLVDVAKLVKSWASPKWTGVGEARVTMDLKRVFVNEPFVIVQHHTTRWEGDQGHHVIDIYRIKDGKFAEHWESVMDVPEDDKLQHSNGLF